MILHSIVHTQLKIETHIERAPVTDGYSRNSELPKRCKIVDVPLGRVFVCENRFIVYVRGCGHTCTNSGDIVSY